MVEVNQADRERAADCAHLYAMECLGGTGRGDEVLAQAFARARTEATAELVDALGWFIADERFQVAVGGNPNVVELMIADAQAILAKHLTDGPGLTERLEN